MDSSPFPSSILRENKTLQLSWATVTWNGKKKARLINASTTKSSQAKNSNHREHLNEPKANNISSRRQTRESKSISPIKGDKRIFLRLPHELEWRILSTAGIREIVVKKQAISPVSISRINPAHIGFAISPCNDDVREKILEGQHGLFMTDAKLDTATNCASVIK